MLTYPFVTLSKPVSPVRLVSREELLRSNPLRRYGKVPSPKKPLPLKENEQEFLLVKGRFYPPLLWSHLGLNQGLPDYESGALTN